MFPVKFSKFLRIHWRLSTILRRNKSVWSNVFWYVKLYIFWKFIQYPAIHWDKTEMSKKFPLDKIDKIHFLSFASSDSSQFYFQFAILIWAEAQGSSLWKHKVRLSKSECGNFSFWFHFVFIKVYILFKKSMDSSTWKRHNSYQNKNNRKATHSFAPKPLIFELQQEVSNVHDICMSRSSPKTHLFELLKSKLWVR